MSRPHALVVGASIAGPTTAYWLSRAGFDITIIERFPTLRPGGQNIDIRSSGVTVMRKIPGMESAVRSKSTTQDAISFVNASGVPYATFKPTGNPAQQSLLSEYEIFRDDLSKILYDLTKDRPGVRYVFGEQVAAMQQDRDKGTVTVEFLEGKLPTSTFDLVVACDGATSRTRAIGLECTVREHVKPMNMWAAYASVKTDYLEGSSSGLISSVPGGLALAAGPDPSTHGSRLAAIAVLPSSPSATHPFRSAQRAGDAALRAHVATHFSAHDGWKSQELVGALTSADDFYASEMVQVRLATLVKGKFTLTGDAAFATGATGTGTSLALTSAYILGGELATHAGDMGAGLAAYEARMRPIAAAMQSVPPGVPGMIAPQTRVGVWLRDALLVVLAWGSRNMGWVMGWVAPAFGGDESGVPEYAWREE